jgi:hypothetical protein
VDEGFDIRCASAAPLTASTTAFGIWGSGVGIQGFEFRKPGMGKLEIWG